MIFEFLIYVIRPHFQINFVLKIIFKNVLLKKKILSHSSMHTLSAVPFWVALFFVIIVLCFPVTLLIQSIVIERDILLPRNTEMKGSFSYLAMSFYTTAIFSPHLEPNGAFWAKYKLSTVRVLHTTHAAHSLLPQYTQITETLPRNWLAAWITSSRFSLSFFLVDRISHIAKKASLFGWISEQSYIYTWVTIMVLVTISKRSSC